MVLRARAVCLSVRRQTRLSDAAFDEGWQYSDPGTSYVPCAHLLPEDKRWAARTDSMQRCSAGCGTFRVFRSEQSGANCPDQASLSGRGCQLRQSWRPPQACATPRRGPSSALRQCRRRAHSPDSPRASASADFSAADIVSPSSAASPAVAPIAPLPAMPRKGLTGLAARVVFGILLGVSGAIVILTGGKFYMGIACLVAYQASQEYFGFLTSKVRRRAVLLWLLYWSVCGRIANGCYLALGGRLFLSCAHHLPCPRNGRDSGVWLCSAQFRCRSPG